MDKDFDFISHIDPEKANSNAEAIVESMSEVQKSFLYLSAHTNASIPRILGFIDKQLKEKNGTTLLQVVGSFSSQHPDQKIEAIFRSTINSFRRHYPLSSVKEYIRDKSEVFLRKDFGLPENKVFFKVESIDWEKINAFLEDHFFLLNLWQAITTHHPNLVQNMEESKEAFLRILNNYFKEEGELPGAFSRLTYKTESNKGSNLDLFPDLLQKIQNVINSYVLDMYSNSKDLGFREDLSLTSFEEILKSIERFIEVNKKLPLKRVMLQKLLEFIEVREPHDNSKYLIYHDVLKLLYPKSFTSDKAFLMEGPIFNNSGSMDIEIRRKKIREVKIAMGLSANG